MNWNRFILTLLCAWIVTSASAQWVTVTFQGSITDSTGNHVPAQLVHYTIRDSIGGQLLGWHQSSADSLGNYSGQLFYNSSLTTAPYAKMWTTDCHGTLYTDSLYLPLGPTSVVQDFTLDTCPPPPCDASFTMVYDSLAGNLSCSASTPQLVYSWNAWSGPTGTNQTFSFSIGTGSYQVVVLTVTDSIGSCGDTLTQGMLTPPPPACAATFTMSYDSVAGTITCTPAMPGQVYSWVASDGTTSNAQTFVVNTNNPGVYTVWLTVLNTSSTCIDSDSHTLIINGSSGTPCQAGFTTSVSGNQIMCTATSPGLMYNWTSGTGVSGTGSTFSFTAPSGTYSVGLTVSDSSGTCSDSSVQSVSTQCDASLTFGYNGNGSFTFTSLDSTLSNYTWLLDGVAVGPNAPVLNWTFTASGVHQVCLQVADTTGCSDSSCVFVFPNIPPPVPCDANFSYFDTLTGTPSTHHFYFAASTHVIGRTYTWIFGDGTADTSAYHYSDHVYDSVGTYTVCLVVSDSACSDTVCQTITATHPGYGSIQGSVLADSNYADTNMVLADAATVYLIEYTPASGGTLTAIDSTATQNGAYVFSGVPAGDYLLKAALDPSSTSYSRFVPAYYVVNSFPGSLNWSGGTSVNVGNTGSWVNLHHDIHTIYGTNPGGPGFVGGLVSQGANKTSGVGDPLEGVLVVLLNGNEEAVAYTYSDANGAFAFDNLALGTYTVHSEIAGLTTNSFILTLGTSYQREDRIRVEVNSSYIDTYIETLTSTIEESHDQTIRLYPVPAGDQLNLEFGSDWNQQAVSIHLYDLTGKHIREWNRQVNGVMTLNLQGMDAGAYVIQVQSGSTVKVYPIIK